MSRMVTDVMVCGIIGSPATHASIAPSQASMTESEKWPRTWRDDLTQRWALPSAPRPIVVIGAGSIVRDAHLPVYRRLNFPLAGIFDVNQAAARERADAFGIPRVFNSLEEA